MITFARPGFRVKSRGLKVARVPKRHKVTQNEAIAFLKENFKVEVER